MALPGTTEHNAIVKYCDTVVLSNTPPGKNSINFPTCKLLASIPECHHHQQKSTMLGEWRYSAYFIRGEQTSGRSRRYITVCKLCGEEVKGGRVENRQQYLIIDYGPTKLSDEEYLKLLEEEQLDKDGLSTSD